MRALGVPLPIPLFDWMQDSWPIPWRHAAGGRAALAVLEGPAAICPACSLGYPLSQGESSSPPLVSSTPGGYADWASLTPQLNKLLGSTADPQLTSLLSQGLTIATGALAIPVAGTVIAAAVAFLAFFGITIRGKTSHIGQAVAHEKAAQFWGQTFAPVIAKLPDDAFDYLYGLASTWERWLWDRNRLAWNAWIQNHWKGWFLDDASVASQSRSQRTSAIQQVNDYWFSSIADNSDAEHVDDSMRQWYLEPLRDQVMRPLDKFMVDKYNATVSAYVAAGGSGAKSISQTLTTGAKAAIAGGVGALALGLALARPGRA